MAGKRHTELYDRKDKEYGWRVKSANGNTTDTAGEGFTTKAGAKKAALREHPDLPLVDKTKPR